MKPILGGVAVIAFLAIVFVFARSGATTLPTDMILYWGEGCPHCANVEAFIEANDVEQQVSFTRKEVYNNKRNAIEMGKLGKQCGIKTEGMGVPFLWTGSQCLQGETDIINFFRAAMGGTGASVSSL